LFEKVAEIHAVEAAEIAEMRMLEIEVAGASWRWLKVLTIAPVGTQAIVRCA